MYKAVIERSTTKRLHVIKILGRMMYYATVVQHEIQNIKQYSHLYVKILKQNKTQSVLYISLYIIL